MFLDSILGRIYSRGVSVVLGSGLDFKSPMSATKNNTTGRIDITLSDADIGTPGLAEELAPHLQSHNIVVDPNDSAQLIHRPSQKLVHLVDEFCSPTGELNWALGGVGVPTVRMVEGDLDSSVGVVSLATSGGVNDSSYLAGAKFKAQYLDRMTWMVDVADVDNTVLTVGFGQDVSAVDFGTSGVYYKFEKSVNPALRTITRDSGGARTETSMFQPQDGEQMLLELRRSGSFLEFYVNETLETAHNTQLPDNDDGFQTFGVRVQTKDTNSRSARIDRFDAELDYSAANRYA